MNIKLNSLLKNRKVAFLDKFSPAGEGDISYLIRSLSLKEKIVFGLFFSIGVIGLMGLLILINDRFLVEVPRSGGSFTEGIVGRPGFINPVLATSETDKDLVNLIYSGLLRRTPSGTLENDLAESLSVSEDGLTYTLVLKEDLYWHDGEPITAEDIIFTTNKIKDPLIKSPLQASWDGVEVWSDSERIITFSLDQPYSLFIENLTLGILPKKIWQDFPADEFNNNKNNTSPIGSGPYQINRIKRDKEGIVESYELKSFKQFALGKPYINKIQLNFYKNEDELLKSFRGQDIDSMGGISAENIAINEIEPANIAEFQLARVFAIFFNQNRADIFTEKGVRSAINKAIDRTELIDSVLGGYGTALDGPLVNFSLNNRASDNADRELAKEIMIENGWYLNENSIFERGEDEDRQELSFDLATANVGELIKAAEIIKKNLEDIGIRVNLKIFEVGDINQEVIRSREYEALLFGEVTGSDPDLYAFWHSSQRLDPGLNIALYTNITADKLLEEARVAKSREERYLKYLEFEKEIKNDLPAAFLYAPDYLYVHSDKLKNVIPYTIVAGSDRFTDIYNWNIKTDKVWEFLIKE